MNMRIKFQLSLVEITFEKARDWPYFIENQSVETP
jgi:hypothetical protein